MKIAASKKGKEEITFDITDTNPAFANALRRVIMTDIPTLAVDEVEVRENTSAMFNEVIAHRLGLVPLVFPTDELKAREDCDCEGKGCPNCTVVFVLDKKGPAMVYSGDLKSTNPAVKPAYDNIPIVKLLEGQSVTVEATAILGTGKKHAKWQAGIGAYSYKDPSKITFTVETISGLTPQQIAVRALEVIEQKAKDLEKSLD